MFDNYDEVKKAAEAFGTDVSNELKLRLRLTEATFKEAFLSAQVSCGFHGEDGQANHIKQVSHIAFWVVKLKPFSLARSTGEWALDTFGMSDTWSKIDAGYKETRLKALSAEINELVAFSLADHLIAKGFEDIEARIEKGEAVEYTTRREQSKAVKELRSRLKENRDRVSRISPEIVRSFREHNYTSRALATMFHLAYSTGHESLSHNEAA